MAAPTAWYVCETGARRSGSEDMELIDDLVRASQAAVSAERMVSMNRAYVLTREPDLLVRAQAAEAKLQHTLRALETRADVLHESPTLASVRTSFERYSGTLQDFLAGATTSTAPAVAEELRRRVIPARDRFETDVDQFITHRRRRIVASLASNGTVAGHAVALMGAICALGIFASASLARAAVARQGGTATVSAFSDSESPEGSRAVPQRQQPNRLQPVPMGRSGDWSTTALDSHDGQFPVGGRKGRSFS